jgi:hypothetical protein
LDFIMFIMLSLMEHLTPPCTDLSLHAMECVQCT